MKSDNFTDDDLKLKATRVSFAIFTLSSHITESLQQQVEELKNLTKEEIDNIFFIVSYILLAETQKFFWENIIQDEKNGTVFENYLYQMYEKESGVNPRPFIKDMVDYIKKQGKGGEVQYIGSKICREIGKIDAFLNVKISGIFSSFMVYDFYEPMKRIWDWNLPN